MALSARLNLRQSQTMTMTPQLLQSIRLLQLTHLELQKFIGEEVERNPLLTQEEIPGSESAVVTSTTQEPVQAGDQDIAGTILSGQVDSANSATPLDNEYPDDSRESGMDPAGKSNSSGGDTASRGQSSDAEIAAIEDWRNQLGIAIALN